MEQRVKLATYMLLSILVSACGGGGSSDTSGSNGGSGGISPPPQVNRAPVVTIASSALSMREGAEASIEFSASDADNDSLTFSVESSSAAVSVSINGSSLKLKANVITELPSRKSSDSSVIKLIVRDGKISAEQQLTVTVENIAPKFSLAIEAGTATKRISSDTALLSSAYSQTLSLETESGISITNMQATTNISTHSFVVNQNTVLLHPSQVQSGTLTFTGETNFGLFEHSFPVHVDENKGPTLIIMGPAYKEVRKGARRDFELQLSDPEGDSVSVRAKSLHADKATANATSMQLSVQGVEFGVASIELLYSDGRTDLTATLQVSVVDNTEPPQITIGDNNFDQHDLSLELVENTDTLFAISVKDEDSNSHQISITQLDSEPGQYKQLPFTIQVDSARYEVRLKSDRIPKDDKFAEGYASMRITVSDGKFSTSKPISVAIKRKANPLPEFSWTGAAKEFGYFVQTESETIRYQLHVTDDDPGYLAYEQSYLPLTKDMDYESLSYEFDPELQQLSVTSNQAKAGGQAFFKSVFYDGLTRLTAMLPVRISNAETEVTLSAKPFIRDLKKKIAAMQEYSFVAQFYAQVLESRNLISSHQAKRYRDAFRSDSSTEQQFGVYRTMSEIYLQRIYSGEYDQNPHWLKSDMEYMQSIELKAVELHRPQLSLINEMADLSGGVLPRLNFETTLNKTPAGFYSRFVGNPTYGTYDDAGEWRFSSEYNLMRAVQALSESAALGTL